MQGSTEDLVWDLACLHPKFTVLGFTTVQTRHLSVFWAVRSMVILTNFPQKPSQAAFLATLVKIRIKLIFPVIA
jgi:hypothetical protein